MLVVPVTEVETRDLDPGLLELIGQRVEAGEPEFLLRDREGALGSRAAARVALGGLLLTLLGLLLDDLRNNQHTGSSSELI